MCFESGLLYLNASPTGLMHNMMWRLFRTLSMRYVNIVSGMSAIPSFLAASPRACLTCAYHRKEIENQISYHTHTPTPPPIPPHTYIPTHIHPHCPPHTHTNTMYARKHSYTHTSSNSSGLYRLGTSPLERMLLMSSRNASSTT